MAKSAISGQSRNLVPVPNRGGTGTDECLKHSDYTRVSIAFSCCLGIIYIVLGIICLI